MKLTRMGILAGLTSVMLAAAATSLLSDPSMNNANRRSTAHSINRLTDVRPDYNAKNRGAVSHGWLLRVRLPQVKVTEDKPFAVEITLKNTSSEKQEVDTSIPEQDYFLLIEDSSGRQIHFNANLMDRYMNFPTDIKPGEQNTVTYTVPGTAHLIPGDYRVTAARKVGSLNEGPAAFVVSNSAKFTVVKSEKSETPEPHK